MEPYNAIAFFHSNELAKLARQSFFEFNDIADYVWKTPRLIDQETKIEKSKLKIYFPDRPALANSRWKHESHKLGKVFPYLMAVGNLFAVMSAFEIYLLLLHGTIKSHLSIDENTVKGQGVTRIFNYLKASGVKVGSVALFAQINAALQIRNCLLHAGGVLSSSREERELRRLEVSRLYLSPEDRRSKAPKILALFHTPLGDRLQITNDYSFLVVSYARDYFLNLCREIDKAHKSIP